MLPVSGNLCHSDGECKQRIGKVQETRIKDGILSPNGSDNRITYKTDIAECQHKTIQSPLILVLYKQGQAPRNQDKEYISGKTFRQ